jgi:uncharacterized protein YeaO (DUF488 family)
VTTAPVIRIKRVYETAGDSDGMRILVDRLWPRGLSKDVARIDYWARDVAPSNELRRWYRHDPEKWAGFLRRYAAELDGMTGAVAELRTRLAPGVVTFVYSSKEEQLNNAVALKAYLEGDGEQYGSS